MFIKRDAAKGSPDSEECVHRERKCSLDREDHDHPIMGANSPDVTGARNRSDTSHPGEATGASGVRLASGFVPSLRPCMLRKVSPERSLAMNQAHARNTRVDIQSQ